ncbi:MAG: hypothetical protein FVQ82_09360, partial [Planctomycetes bacterium]|nr:hypothetical protein [Planctomycetota bacterium]
MKKTIMFAVAAALVLALGATAQAAVLFSVDHDNLPAVGATVETWESAGILNDGFTRAQGNPTVVELDGVKWYSNKYATSDKMRHNSGNHASGDNIAINGATIVAAVKPERTTGGDWHLVVDIFYSQLCLGIHNESGRVKVKIGGSAGQNPTWTSPVDKVIPEEPGVLTLSVGSEGDPAFEVFWQGADDPEPISMGTGNGSTGGGAYTALYAQAPDRPYGGYINIGSNNPDTWPTYNGLIGDTIVFDEQLSPEELSDVRNQVLAAMGIRGSIGYDFDPDPADEATVLTSAVPLTLSWSNLPPDPCNVADSTLVDVWWDTLEDGTGGTQVLTESPDALTVDVTADVIGTYYWKIVATDPNTDGTPVVTGEAVYSLIAESLNVEPTVEVPDFYT